MTSRNNPYQQLAIDTTEGPVLIIAGPGAGKTRTLVERTVNLIQKGTKPEEILVATFTEKAAKELVTRISNRLLELEIKVNLNEMYIGTLHSIFLRFLEEYREFTRLKRSYRLLDQFDQKFFLYQNMRDFVAIENSEEILGGHNLSSWYKADKLINYINKVGEENLDFEELISAEDANISVIGEFYKLYIEKLNEENALDFSSIQSETYSLLKDNQNVLDEIQSKIKYFMIDEYQDTNTIQEKIILLIASKIIIFVL